ncbi:MAG: Transketolase, partial [uncultured Solirubrobacterales bacterium]
MRATKRFYGWPEEEHFHVPDGVPEHVAGRIVERGGELRRAWGADFDDYRAEHPDLAEEVERMQRRELPDGWDDGLPEFSADEKGTATRASSGEVLNVLAQNVPWLLGGAADLFPSTKTRLTFDGAGDFSPGDH